MPGLRADYPWHARCLPAAHAAHRRGAGVAHPHPTKQDCSSGCAHAPSGKRVGGGQAWPTRGPPMAYLWPRRRTGLGWAPPRRDVLTGGKIFGENMAGKLSQTSMADKGFILCWLANNNNYIKNSPLSQNCLFLIDFNKIGIIVMRRFFSFIIRSVIILNQGYNIFLLIRKMITNKL